MEKEKKFKVYHPGLTYDDVFKRVEDALNSLADEVEKLKGKPRVAATGGSCTKWCAYQGYQAHLPDCSRKGPT